MNSLATYHILVIWAPKLSSCNTLQHTATHCNTLQHTATHCNTLQHTATHLRVQANYHILVVMEGPEIEDIWHMSDFSRVLQCVAVCCSVLQCVAECCSVLQRCNRRHLAYVKFVIRVTYMCDMTHWLRTIFWWSGKAPKSRSIRHMSDALNRLATISADL